MGIIDQAAMMLAREAISKTVEFVVGKAEEHHEGKIHRKYEEQRNEERERKHEEYLQRLNQRKRNLGVCTLTFNTYDRKIAKEYNEKHEHKDTIEPDETVTLYMKTEYFAGDEIIYTLYYESLKRGFTGNFVPRFVSEFLAIYLQNSAFYSAITKKELIETLRRDAIRDIKIALEADAKRMASILEM